MNKVTENGVHIEVYKSSTDSVPLKMPSYVRSYKDYAESLGFKRVGSMTSARVKSQICKALFKPLTDKEQKILFKKFPTTYNITSDESRDVYNYQFDLIPYGVLKEIDDARKSKLFDRLYIFTPEKRVDPDPLLIGVVNSDYYLIARWGTELVPFEKLVNWTIKTYISAHEGLQVTMAVMGVFTFITMVITLARYFGK